MSINKSQGQIMIIAGVDNIDPCHTHDQFYNACSRVSSEKTKMYASGQKMYDKIYKEILGSQ